MIRQDIFKTITKIAYCSEMFVRKFGDIVSSIIGPGSADSVLIDNCVLLNKNKTRNSNTCTAEHEQSTRVN